MKRGFGIFVGLCLGLVVGGVAAFFFNTWYTTHFVRGDEDSNFLITLLIFGFLPGFALIGGLAANRFYMRSSV
jgi:hypothetical protein